MSWRMTMLFAAAAAAAVFSAHAGEVNLTDGTALKGHDPIAYFREGKPVRGDEKLSAEHKGARYLFSSAANRDEFRNDPQRYAPQYGGYCAFGVSRGYKADIDSAAFSIVEGKLYVNFNAKVREDWLKDPAGFIRTADAKWPEVRTTTKVFR